MNDLSSYRDSPESKASFERLIRRILGRPNKPAVIVLNAHQHADNHPESEVSSLYLHNAEAYFFDVATYYGTQLASGKAATWRLSQAGAEGFWVNGTWFTSIFDVKSQTPNPNPPSEKVLSNFLFWDNHHYTSINGHRALAELLIEIVVHASRQLLNDLRIDEKVINEALPPPIFKGNYAPRTETCLLGNSLRTAVAETSGFNWANEQREKNKSPKWGWTGFGSGSELKINISTSIGQNQTNDSQPAQVSLSIGYLASYDPIMAEFELICLSGCVCERAVFDGLDGSRKVSQLTMKKVLLTQSEQCIISIKILGGGTPTPECKERCKVKIGALVLEEGLSSSVDGDKLELAGEIFVGGVLRKDYGAMIKDPNI